MFPKDTEFEKDMVVRLWMAQGYINGNTRNLETLEEIGSEYFDELQGRSLVEKAYASSFSTTKYCLHDLTHDLARSISQEAYRPILENDQQCKDLCKVYHLYLTEPDESLGSFLVPNNYWSIRTSVNVCLTENSGFAFFPNIPRARALQLSHSLLPDTLNHSLLPSTLCTLKHLRYLSVKHCQIESLPETLCLLYNLQTLDLHCINLRELPENIKNLINLRYFQLSSGEILQLPKSIFLLHNLHTLSLRYCKKLKELPRGIEQLTRLRILDSLTSFIYLPCGIGKLTTLKPLSGHFSVMAHGMIGGVGELKDMNELSGLLCIAGLRNISDVKHSRNANLASKPNLHELILNFQEDDSIWSCTYKGILPLVVHSSKNARNKNYKWPQDVVPQSHLHLTVSSSKNANKENDEKIRDVLQSLQPHGNLTELAILNYVGRIFPSWLLNPLLPKLTTLTLNFWTEPNFLPPFGQLPHLRFLDISGNAGVRNVGDEPSTYSLLVEYDLFEQPKKPSYPSLEVLSLRNMLNLVEWQGYDGDFPCLKKLTIENCPKLWKSAIIPQGVREVTFIHCPKLKLLTCPSVIKILKIHECGFHEIIFRSVCENLKISNCVDLFTINWSDESLNAVEVVTSECCSKLKLPFTVKDVLHSMIQRAEIYDCPRLNLGKEYVYQRDPKIDGELTLYGNGGQIQLSGISTIPLVEDGWLFHGNGKIELSGISRFPLVENSFALFLTKKDFLELESLTCAPSVGVSCQNISVPSLVKVNISCRKVISVTGLDNLSNLKRLIISYCPELCKWNDKTLPLSIKFLELDSCDKLSSLPLLSVQNHLSTLKELVIKKCPRLAVLEGFHGLTKLKYVDIRHCRNISISHSCLQFVPHITLRDCPLIEDWCQRNNISFFEGRPFF